MVREYILSDIKNWCHELADAVMLFEKECMKKPKIVGYSDNTYNQINLIVNQEKENVVDVEGTDLHIAWLDGGSNCLYRRKIEHFS